MNARHTGRIGKQAAALIIAHPVDGVHMGIGGGGHHHPAGAHAEGIDGVLAIARGGEAVFGGLHPFQLLCSPLRPVDERLGMLGTAAQSKVLDAEGDPAVYQHPVGLVSRMPGGQDKMIGGKGAGSSYGLLYPALPDDQVREQGLEQDLPAKGLILLPEISDHYPELVAAHVGMGQECDLGRGASLDVLFGKEIAFARDVLRA